MFNPRRFLRTTIIAILLGVLTAGVVRAVNPPEGPPAPAAPSGLKAKIEAAPAPSQEADILFPTVKIQGTHGTHELNVDSLKELAIDSTDGGVVQANVLLHDETRYHGKLLTPELKVNAGGTTQALELKEGLRIKFLRPNDHGLLGAIIGLFTLALMEIVLGIDNIVMLAILSGRLPEDKQPKARRIGLAAALLTRLALLFAISWLLGLTKPLFHLPEMPLLHDPESRGISLRDLALLIGGLFLIRKSVKELHHDVEGGEDGESPTPVKSPSFVGVIFQIALIDIVFSLDSVITAVGMVDQLWVMVVAMLIAVGVMLMFAEVISRFVGKHPTVKVLALSFLILIGALLVAEGLGQHIDKGYIYFAMAFAIIIEVINMRMRKAKNGN